MSTPRIAIAGQSFGRLTAISFVRLSSSNGSIWLFECQCGARKEIDASKVKTGKTLSCGCLLSESGKRIARANIKHGHSMSTGPSPTYRSWYAMIQRCTSTSGPNHVRYHDRGITVCDRWRDSFEAFLADMGERPTGKSLDRFPNNDGNYEPGNCRWATQREQNLNTSRSIEKRTREIATHEDGDA